MVAGGMWCLQLGVLHVWQRCCRQMLQVQTPPCCSNGVQVRALQPVELVATVTCTTHARALARCEWRIARASDSDNLSRAAGGRAGRRAPRETADAPPDASTPRLTPEAAMHRVSTVGHKGAVGRARLHAHPRRTHDMQDASVRAAAAPAAHQDLADVFVGAGALRVELEVWASLLDL